MSDRAAARLAWGLYGFALALVPPSLVFGVLALDVALPPGRESFLAAIVVADVLVILWGAVAAAVASRHPRNPIGWLFCFVAVAAGLVSFGYGYGDYTLYGVGDLPLALPAAWLANWLAPPALFIAPLLLMLLFPDGRAPSPRWRPAVRVIGVIAATTVITQMFQPGDLVSFPGVENPVGPSGATAAALRTLDTATSIAAVPAFLVALAAIVARWRRARGRERLQLKWIAYVAGVMCTGFGLSFLTGVVLDAPGLADVLFLFGMVGLVSLPVAAGIAILRHRLYDIDRLINRTLVYGALTISLAGVYLGGVVSLQSLLAPLTEGSDLAIAGSTLAVAAMFRPGRSRIQAGVDRRFYRRRYDAAHTLERFSAHLRDEVDIDSLQGELRGVVGDTMQPAHVSLWLRAPEARR